MNVNNQKVIVFHSKKGNFTILRDTISEISSTYLFEPNQLPKHISSIDIEDDKVVIALDEMAKDLTKNIDRNVKYLWNKIKTTINKFDQEVNSEIEKRFSEIDKEI